MIRAEADLLNNIRHKTDHVRFNVYIIAQFFRLEKSIFNIFSDILIFYLNLTNRVFLVFSPHAVFCVFIIANS